MESEKKETATTDQKKDTAKAVRSAAIMKLLKRKREKDADQVLKQLLNEQSSADLLAGFKHNQFGGFCLQANDLIKSQDHLFKAYQVISQKWKIPATNILMNIGNLYGQKRDYKKAIEYYQKVIEISPHGKPEYVVLPQDCPFDSKKYSSIVYAGKLNSQVAYIDAHTNISVMLIQIDEIQKAYVYCQKALQMQPDNSESIINFTDILRQLGKKEEAIQKTWDQIVDYTKKTKDQNYKGFEAIQISPFNKNTQQKQTGQKFINILSVKWGARYPASYVNKLYSGIVKYTTYQFKFYCFTDDKQGLHPDIIVMPLEEGWKKWWGKVTLFKDHGIVGRKFYIDLDMIITGNLDQLFSYSGMFGTLRTGDLACQKNHKDGYNSSVMIWNDNILTPIYEALKNNFEIINKFIVRFDFWLQMTIKDANYLQQIYPGHIIDFLADAKQKLPAGSRVVCFARKPKPEDYPAEWVKEYWVQ